MMESELVVKKYGGTSLDSPERIRAVAEKIAAAAGRSERIVVTVSAMGKTTDGLLALAERISTNPSRRELDMLLTAGERITMSLLSMALNDLGVPAISFTGSQSGIITSLEHTDAVIEEIRADRILSAIEEGKVAIVAGFQGVSRAREVTTLGRGGSDTTAVALACRLGARRCEIYSDYTGLFSADPRFVRGARRVPRISYDEMVELAAMGAGVLHYRAADLARRGSVPLLLLSSFEDSPGTTVGGSEEVEHPEIKSITFEEEAAVLRLETEGGVETVERLVELLEEMEPRPIHLHTWSLEGSGGVLCVGDVEKLREALARLDEEPVQTVHSDLLDHVSTVSIVGSGFARSTGALKAARSALRRVEIRDLFAWSTPLSVNLVVPRDLCRKAVSSLHESLLGEPGLFNGGAKRRC